MAAQKQQIPFLQKRLRNIDRFRHGELDNRRGTAQIMAHLDDFYWFEGEYREYEIRRKAAEAVGKPKASESPEGEAGFRYQICVSDKTWAEMLQNQKKEFLDSLAFHIWGRRAGQGTKIAVAKLICEHVKKEKVLLGYLLDQDSMRVLHWMSQRRDGELMGWDEFQAVGLERLIRLCLADFRLKKADGCQTGVLVVPRDAGEYIGKETNLLEQKGDTLEADIAFQLNSLGRISLSSLYQFLREKAWSMKLEKEAFERFVFLRLVFWGYANRDMKIGDEWFVGAAGRDLQKLRVQQEEWRELPYRFQTGKEAYKNELGLLADYLTDQWAFEEDELASCIGELEQWIKGGAGIGMACEEFFSWFQEISHLDILNFWSGIYQIWRTAPVYALKGHSREEAAQLLGVRPESLVVAEPGRVTKRKARALWYLPLEIQGKAYQAIQSAEEEQWEKVRYHCREVLAVQPEQREIQELLATALTAMGDYAQAEALVTGFLKKEKDDENLLSQLVIIRGLSGDKERFRALPDEYPKILKSFQGYYSYGTFWIKLKEYEEAARCFRELAAQSAGYESPICGQLPMLAQLHLFMQLLTMDYEGKEAWILSDTERYIQTLKQLLKNCDDRKYEQIREAVGHTIIEYSKKLEQVIMRKPFLTLLAYVEQAGILAYDEYSQIVETGYVAYESWMMNDDKRLSQELCQLVSDCEELYRSGDEMSLAERREIKDVILLEEYEVLKDYPACLSQFDVVEREYGRTYERTIQSFANKVRTAGSISVLKNQYEKSIRKKGIQLVSEAQEWNMEDVFDSGFQIQEPIARQEKKIGRNDPCPCGSGKKYKKCCGK